MDDHATVTCESCNRDFAAALPLSRSALARSQLMFLVEVCPHCAHSRCCLRTDYRFAARQLASA